MTKGEIKEALEIVEKSHPYAVKYKGVKEDEALQTLLSLARRALELDEELEGIIHLYLYGSVFNGYSEKELDLSRALRERIWRER